MKIKNIFKKIASFSTLTLLIVSLASPINLAAAEDDALLQLYRDQAKEYEGNDLRAILTASANVLHKTGQDPSCQNFTRYMGKPSFNSPEAFTAEAFTMEFKKMMDFSPECMKFINKNLSLVGSKLYGPGQIIDSFNYAAIAIQNHPGAKFIDSNAPQKEVAVEPEVVPKIIKEDMKPEVVPEVIKEDMKPEVVPEVIKEDMKPEVIYEVIEEPGEEPTENTVIYEPIVEEGSTTTKQPSEEPYVIDDDDNDDNNNNRLPDFFEAAYNLEVDNLGEVVELANLDSDGDGLTNKEEYLYGTDPTEPDSDFDGISDKDERRAGTDPSNDDSDGDGLLDGDENPNHNGSIDPGETDPNNWDTDKNGMSDFVQKKLGIPAGTTISSKNNAEAFFTKETGIVIETGYQDTDLDGIADAVELIKGTDPTTNNSFNNGFSDGEVIFDYRNTLSQRKRRLRAGELIRSTKKARIINIKNGEVILDKTPLIKGNAPEHSTVVFYYRDQITGVAIEMGEVIATGGNKFIFEPAYELPLGRQRISARVFNNNRMSIDYIAPIEITIVDEAVYTEIAKAPTVESINEITLDSNAELEKTLELTPEQRAAKIEKLKLQYYEKGQKNTIRGYANPGSIVEVYWQSLIVSSAVMTDAEGYFEVSPPDSAVFEPGDHTVWLYSVDPNTEIKSNDTTFEFSISEGTVATILKLDGNQNVILLLIGLLILVGGATFIVKRKNKIPTPLS